MMRNITKSPKAKYFFFLKADLMIKCQKINGYKQKRGNDNCLFLVCMIKAKFN